MFLLVRPAAEFPNLPTDIRLPARLLFFLGVLLVFLQLAYRKKGAPYFGDAAVCCLYLNVLSENHRSFAIVCVVRKNYDGAILLFSFHKAVSRRNRFPKENLFVL